MGHVDFKARLTGFVKAICVFLSPNLLKLFLFAETLCLTFQIVNLFSELVDDLLFMTWQLIGW